MTPASFGLTVMLGFFLGFVAAMTLSMKADERAVERGAGIINGRLYQLVPVDLNAVRNTETGKSETLRGER